MSPELVRRLTIGPLLGGLTIGAFWLDVATGHHLGTLVVLAVGLAFGLRELRRMAVAVAGPVQVLPAVVISYALLLVTFVSRDEWTRAFVAAHDRILIDRLIEHRMPLSLVLIGIALMWTALIQMRRRAFERFFTNVALTVFGVVYMGVSTSLLLHLAMITGDAAYYGTAEDFPNRGNLLLLMFLASCKLGDVTAFFGGRMFGRTKMAPRISPGKTWEGFAFSFVGAIGGAYLFAWILGRVFPPGPFNGWWQPAVWGLILGPLGVAGDLAESCMKREAARKDSGSAIPGFGGFLDIFDALVLAVPVGYVLALVL